MFAPLCKLGPGLARPPAPTAGAFFFGEFVASADSAPAPQVRTVARLWRQRTNVWRRVTSPVRGAKRLRSGIANGQRHDAPGSQIDRAPSRAHPPPGALWQLS